MQYDIEINGRVRRVVVRRTGDAYVVEVDGRALSVDVARIDTQSMSLLIDAPADRQGLRRTSSFDVTVAANGVDGRLSVGVGSRSFTASLDGLRRRRRGPGAHDGDGPQRISAPMPGKVVRVLVKVGDTVRARQPIVVIEAMKMENELRSGRDGVVAEMHAREGQSVDAGALLAVVAAPRS